MGKPMATRLVEAGYKVVVYNRTRSKAQIFAQQYPDQVEIVESPREMASQADVIFSMVSDDRGIKQIAENETGLLSGLGPNHIWVDSSTISPQYSRTLTTLAAQSGAARLEAPVSGSVDAAQAGTLLMFIGGRQDILDKVRPVLGHMARRIEWVGDPGQALALKLGINLNLALQIVGFVEGMMVAESAGVPKEKAMEYMLDSVIASPSLKYRVPLAFTPPEDPWFTVKLMLKDLDLALAQAHSHASTIPLSTLTADLLRLAVHNGRGDEDFAALIPYISTLAGPHKS